MDLLESFGSILESVFFERLVHGQVRPGFLLGMGIMLLSAIMMCFWYMTNPDVHSYIAMSGFAFCFGVGLIGSLIQTNADIDDQESGRFSKMGSGWNLWGDNIIFNRLGQMVLFVLIITSFSFSFYFFTESAHQVGEANVTHSSAKTILPAKSHTTTHVTGHTSASAHHHKAEQKARSSR